MAHTRDVRGRDKSGRTSLTPASASCAGNACRRGTILRRPSGNAEVEFLDVLVVGERLGVAVHHHAAVLQNVAVAREAQRHIGVLLGEQERHAFLVVEVFDDHENLLDDLRRQPHRRLVEQDHLRARHQRAADRAHLLLAARGVAGQRILALGQLGEIAIDHVDVALGRGLAVGPREGAGQQIFLDGEMAEAMAAFHHLDAAAPDQIVGRAVVHLGAVEQDRALGDLAAFGMQQIGDRLQRGGLAGAVGPEQRHDAALRHVERHALEHQNDAVVDDLDVAHREKRLLGGGRCGDCGR